jgi:hypothetical protein
MKVKPVKQMTMMKALLNNIIFQKVTLNLVKIMISFQAVLNQLIYQMKIINQINKIKIVLIIWVNKKIHKNLMKIKKVYQIIMKEILGIHNLN